MQIKIVFLFIFYLFSLNNVISEDAEEKKKRKLKEELIKKYENKVKTAIKENLKKKKRLRGYLDQTPGNSESLKFQVYHNDGTKEVFEYIDESKKPKDNGFTKSSWRHFSIYENIYLTYRPIYDVETNAFENAIDFQLDSVFTFGARLSQYEKNDTDKYGFTFFTGIGFNFFKTDYGYSTRNISQLRFRFPINLIRVILPNNSEYSSGLYSKYYNKVYYGSLGEIGIGRVNTENFHWRSIIKSLVLDPSLELRYLHGKNKFSVAFGLSIGFSF